MAAINAVLTGDLIASRSAGTEAVEASMTTLHETACALGQRNGFDPRFTRYRGDGWQILIPDPRHALTTCVGLTAALRLSGTGLATRIAVGLGPVDSPGSKDLSDAAGRAFEDAGYALDIAKAVRSHERIVFAGPGSNIWLNPIASLTGWVMVGWTALQAEAVALILLDDNLKTNEERANALGISRQAFEARLKGSGFAAIKQALDAFILHFTSSIPTDD